MLTNVLVVILLCFGLIHAKSFADENEARSGRWFGYRYTITVTEQEAVTSLIPSSCVHVEPSLPPCRSVRILESFPRFIGSERKNGRQLAVVPQQPAAAPTPIVHTTELGWGEYLGFYAPTVTVSTLKQLVTTILDPRVVVTFSVKGCKPSRLPLDLMECQGSGQNVIIQPTATIPQLVTQTVRPIDTNVLSLVNIAPLQSTNTMVETSENNLNVNNAANSAPTAPL